MARKELSKIKENLKDNLWRIINKKPVEPIHFKEYLMGVLIQNNYNIVSIPISFLETYSSSLRKEYAAVLDYLEQNLLNKDIFELEKYIKQQVNGYFSFIISSFLKDYEKT